jgi:hypothetical protein
VVVDDRNPCTVDACNSTTGVITHLPVAVDDNNPCTADSCEPSVGVRHVPLSGPCCSTGNPLTNGCCASGVPRITANEACTYACYDAMGRMTAKTVCRDSATCNISCP